MCSGQNRSPDYYSDSLEVFRRQVMKDCNDWSGQWARFEKDYRFLAVQSFLLSIVFSFVGGVITFYAFRTSMFLSAAIVYCCAVAVIFLTYYTGKNIKKCSERKRLWIVMRHEVSQAKSWDEIKKCVSEADAKMLKSFLTNQ